jgi:hypothetical protein
MCVGVGICVCELAICLDSIPDTDVRVMHPSLQLITISLQPDSLCAFFFLSFFRMASLKFRSTS